MAEGELLIGGSEEGPVRLPVAVLKRHVTVLGASGSGKTVLGKCFIEEATLAGIPSVLIDPQGDLASLALPGRVEEIEAHEGDPTRLLDFTQKAEVRIFTPASSKGLPLSLDPLRLPAADQLSPDERIRAVDLVAKGLTQLLGYEGESEEGRGCTAFLYQLIEQLWEQELAVEDFARLADLVADPEGAGLEAQEDFLSEKERQKLAKKVRRLSVGLKQLMFNFGVPVDMETFLEPANETKVPVNIIYLNTLNNEQDKQFFVSMVAKEIYTWMLGHPSDKVQLAFYIDEVSTYLPPHPRNPPAKEMLTLLFKQGRKYGVSCLMCTQNPADIDYKAMAQANTWALGRMMTKQDLGKVSHMLKSMAPQEVDQIMASLPNLSAGHFVLICPDVAEKALQFKARWLLTRHTTLEEERLADLMPKGLQDHFDQVLKERRQRESREPDPSMPSPSPPTPPPAIPTPAPEVSGQPLPAVEPAPGAGPGPGPEGQPQAAPGESLRPPGKARDYQLVPRLRVSQAQVTQMAEKERESSLLLFKGETVGEIRLFYQPVYRCEYQLESKRLGLLKAEHQGSLYFNGQTGELLHIETDVIPPSRPKALAFTRHVDQKPWDYKSLTDFPEYSREYIRKEELAALNQIKKRPPKGGGHDFSKQRMKTRFKRLFGEQPRKITPEYLPVWELNLHDKRIKGAIRRVYIDGLYGKHLELE